MMASTVVPPTVTWIEVPPIEVRSGKAVATTTFAGPRFLPLTTNSAPWAIGALGSPGGMLVAAFSIALIMGAFGPPAAGQYVVYCKLREEPALKAVISTLA